MRDLPCLARRASLQGLHLPFCAFPAAVPDLCIAGRYWRFALRCMRYPAELARRLRRGCVLRVPMVRLGDPLQI